MIWGQRRLSLILTLITAGVLVFAACTPAQTNKPTAPPPPTGYVVVIVTLTPSPTPSLTPTATLPYRVESVQGTWRIDLNYQVAGDAIFQDIRFVGTVGIDIDFGGNLTGSVEFFPSVQQPPCSASVLDSEPLRATVQGSLRLDPNAEVVADLKIVPQDPLQLNRLRLFCPTFKEEVLREEPIFWTALSRTGGLDLSIPLRVGYYTQNTVELSGPTSGALRGMLFTEIAVNR